MLIATLDGGCWKNPGGPAAAACIITRDGIEVYRTSKLLPEHPKMTNNVAEFEGIKLILEWLQDNSIAEHAHIISDSQIVINRLSGKSRKPPVGACADIARECVKLAKSMGGARKFTFEWKSRLANTECDHLCTQKMRQYMRSSKVPSYMNDDKGFRYGAETI